MFIAGAIHSNFKKQILNVYLVFVDSPGTILTTAIW